MTRKRKDVSVSVVERGTRVCLTVKLGRGADVLVDAVEVEMTDREADSLALELQRAARQAFAAGDRNES